MKLKYIEERCDLYFISDIKWLIKHLKLAHERIKELESDVRIELARADSYEQKMIEMELRK